MTRLIDADALNKKLCETTTFIKDGEKFQRMINDAPTIKLDGDLISRQAAIDALESIGSLDTDADREYARSVFETLPSAQPEIIRCKDCKHWDGVDTCDVIDAPVWDKDFCSMAERRTDEE